MAGSNWGWIYAVNPVNARGPIMKRVDHDRLGSFWNRRHSAPSVTVTTVSSGTDTGHRLQQSGAGMVWCPRTNAMIMVSHS